MGAVVTSELVEDDPVLLSEEKDREEMKRIYEQEEATVMMGYRPVLVQVQKTRLDQGEQAKVGMARIQTAAREA